MGYKELTEALNFLVEHEYHPIAIYEKSQLKHILVEIDIVPFHIGSGWNHKWVLEYGITDKNDLETCSFGYSGASQALLDKKQLDIILSELRDEILKNCKENFYFPEMSDVYRLDTESDEYHTHLENTLDKIVSQGCVVVRF